MDNESFVGRDKSFYEQLGVIIGDKIKEKEEFDKKFFYIISSFFAFSILLVQFIKEPAFVYYLLRAWSFNLLALISHLLAYLMAIKAHDEKTKVFLKMKQNDDNEKNKVFKLLFNIERSAWVRVATITEVVGYICFVLAIISLLIFVYFNLVLV